MALARLVLPLAAVLLLSGCGSAGAGYSEAELLANPCVLLTDAEIEQTLGGPVTTETEPLTTGIHSGMRCKWERPTKSLTELAPNVVLSYLPPVEGMTESFKDPQQQGADSELLEIGDAAVWVPGVGLLHVAVDDATILISGRDRTRGGAIPKETLVGLAKAAASRMN